MLRAFWQRNKIANAFEAYRNKRLSKLIILDWYHKFGAQYDMIVLADNDLYIQKDIHTLFEKAYHTNPDKIHYWQEENTISPGSDLWIKNLQFSELHDILP